MWIEMKIRVLIADDHLLLRQGIRKVLELEPDFEVVDEAMNGQEALSKTLILEPDILLLDDATANLDSESERKIQDALEELMENRTTIVIAHRLSTIKKAEQIIFIDNGNVTGIGTHQALMASHEKYQQFVHTQNLTR